MRKETVLLGIRIYNKCACWKYLQSAPAQCTVYLCKNNNDAVLGSWDLELSKERLWVFGYSCAGEMPGLKAHHPKWQNKPTSHLCALHLPLDYFYEVFSPFEGQAVKAGIHFCSLFGWGIRR